MAMTLILRPLECSNDLVLICDRKETVLAAVHIDTFLDGVERGVVYDALYRGHSVTVTVERVEEE